MKPLGAVKRVQRGTIGVNATIVDVTVTEVDTEKAMLSHLGTAAASTSDCVKLELLNATTVRAQRSGSGGTVPVGFELVEFQ